MGRYKESMFREYQTCIECGLFRECCYNGDNPYCRECVDNRDRLKYFKQKIAEFDYA